MNLRKNVIALVIALTLALAAVGSASAAKHHGPVAPPAGGGPVVTPSNISWS